MRLDTATPVALLRAGSAKIDWGRLFACLAVSCLLHGALILAPRFGTRSVASGGGAPGAASAAGARILHASLARARQPAQVKPDARPIVEKPAEKVEEMQAPLSAAPPATKAESGSAAESTLGAGLLPLDAPVFHTADQLTLRPRPLAQPNLEAAVAAGRPLLGTVILKLWIGEVGEVISVEIEDSQVPVATAVAAADAFAKLRFAPGEINGRAVGAIMRIEVSYDAPPPELPPASPLPTSPPASPYAAPAHKP